MQKKLRAVRFLCYDTLASVIIWFLTFNIIDEAYRVQLDNLFYPGLYAVASIWTGIFIISGSYHQILRKSRLKELSNTLLQTLFGTSLVGCYLFLQGLFIIDFISIYFLLQLSVISFLRLIRLTKIKRRMHQRKLGYSTLIIGNNNQAVKWFKELSTQKHYPGYLFRGFISCEPDDLGKMEKLLPHLGDLGQTQKILKEHQIEEVIIAVEPGQQQQLKSILEVLESSDVIINIIPDIRDILSGFVKMNYIFSLPLITIYPEPMPLWQRIVKRAIDLLLSSLVLIICLPVFLLIALLIKTNSNGPIFFTQERIGRKGQPFSIFKFRTMIPDAESAGPLLSSANDPRITSLGRFLRKSRLDELPQFLNVLTGTMTLVGPRPERRFYIDQIIKKAPHYHYVHKVRPGITSLGQVKYGYAETVEQMVKRLTFDILYLENRSLALDMKIILYTLLTVVQGRGK